MNILKNIIRFVFLLLLQLLLFNHLNLYGLCHPYIYIMGLICMPLLPRWVDMLIAFAIGLLMDMFCSSLGIHVAACVLLAYLRPFLLAKLVQDPERVMQDVGVGTVGLSQFIRLAVALCLIHHAVVFMMDAGSFAHFSMTLCRWAISSMVSLLFILGYGIVRES